MLPKLQYAIYLNSIGAPNVVYSLIIDMKYLPGKDISFADAHFRAFIKDDVFSNPDMLCTVNSISKCLLMSGRRINQFKSALQSDEELKLVMNYYNEEWPEKEKSP